MAGSWPCYSIRFLHGNDKDVMHVFTVPDGYRAVVKAVSLLNRSVAGGYVQVRVHGIFLVNYTFPDTFRTVTVATMTVAFERETIDYYSGGQTAEVLISGYLLRDDGTAPREAENVHERVLERAELLPHDL